MLCVLKVNIQKIARRATPFLTAVIVLLCCLAPARAGAVTTDNTDLLDFSISYADEPLGWMGCSNGNFTNYYPWANREERTFTYSGRFSFSGNELNEVGIALKNSDSSFLIPKGSTGVFSLSNLYFGVYDEFADKWFSLKKTEPGYYSLCVYMWGPSGEVGSKEIPFKSFNVSNSRVSFAFDINFVNFDVVKMVVGLRFHELAFGSRFEMGIQQLQFRVDSTSSLNFAVSVPDVESDSSESFYNFNDRDYILSLDGSDFYRYRVQLTPKEGEHIVMKNQNTKNTATYTLGDRVWPMASTPYTITYTSPKFDCSNFPLMGPFTINSSIVISGPPDGKGYSFSSQSAVFDFYDSSGKNVGSFASTLVYDSELQKYVAAFDFNQPTTAVKFTVSIVKYDSVFFSSGVWAYIDYLEFCFSEKRDPLKELTPMPEQDTVIVHLFAEDGKTKLGSFWGYPLGHSLTIGLQWNRITFNYGFKTEYFDFDHTNIPVKLIPLEVKVKPPYNNYLPVIEQYDVVSIEEPIYIALKVQREVTPDEYLDLPSADGVIGDMSGSAGSLEQVGDVMANVPKPNFAVSDLVPTDVLAGPDFMSYITPIKEFWNSGVLSTLTTILGGLLLLSYVLFGEKG